MIEGFDEFPKELKDVHKVTVECPDDVDYAPEACGEYSETFSVAPRDIMMDNSGLIHFRDLPTECPECDNIVALRYNGVVVAQEP